MLQNTKYNNFFFETLIATMRLIYQKYNNQITKLNDLLKDIIVSNQHAVPNMFHYDSLEDKS